MVPQFVKCKVFTCVMPFCHCLQVLLDQFCIRKGNPHSEEFEVSVKITRIFRA